MIDFKKIRGFSSDKCKDLGYDYNPNLPLLDFANERSLEEVVNRTCILYGLVACSYGATIDFVKSWYNMKGLTQELTEDERDLLNSARNAEDFNEYKPKVEALWVLTWSLSHFKKLDFSTHCGDNLIELMPNIDDDDTFLKFKEESSLRSTEQIVQQCDLSYCLHWSLVDSKLNGRKKKKNHVLPHVIIERRHALEWLISEDKWDEISLDT